MTYAAVMVLATHRADVNGVVRRHLGARKISFAARDDAVGRTGMEFGGITPVGLPEGWPVLVDEAVAVAGEVVIGSGLRRSKLLLTGEDLLACPAPSASRSPSRCRADDRRLPARRAVRGQRRDWRPSPARWPRRGPRPAAW